MHRIAAKCELEKRALERCGYEGLDDEFAHLAERSLETTVEINPVGNTALEGLYMSGSMFCTQCEAEGFRRITYFPDRPDVMAVYRVRLVADQEKYPVLLSNGNLVDSGDMSGGRHFTVWDDPTPKSCCHDWLFQ